MRTWAVSLVLLAAVAAGCSGVKPLDLAEFPPDAVLDCTDDSEWGIQGSPDPDAEGFFTANDALLATLAPYIEDDDDLELQDIREGVASLLDSNNREMVFAGATEVTPGNWFVDTIGGCSGFERF